MRNKLLHVAVGVVMDASGNVLICQRPPGKHLAGLWEFPGGKVEQGEDVRQALRRELHEEVGLDVEPGRPLIRLHHRYTEHDVCLDVWRLDRFDGVAYDKEGQNLAWVPPQTLSQFAMPEINRVIATALNLPTTYLITPVLSELTRFLDGLEAALIDGVRLIQLRQPQLSVDDLSRWAEAALAVCRRYGARLLINEQVALASELKLDGVHLTARQLLSLDQRPLPAGFLVAGSCHNAHELSCAQTLGLDFAVLSPIRQTPSHPATVAVLGWEGFGKLVEGSNLPVYALGGVGITDLDQAFACYGQGIAAIRGLWAG